MLFYYLDANALAKAYVNEKGSDAVNLLFDQVPSTQLLTLIVNLSETISIFVRKKNAGIVTYSLYQQILVDFKSDRRLQTAAEVEGIHTINPELDSLEKIEKLIQPIESGNINCAYLKSLL